MNEEQKIIFMKFIDQIADEAYQKGFSDCQKLHDEKIDRIIEVLSKEISK